MDDGLFAIERVQKGLYSLLELHECDVELQNGPVLRSVPESQSSERLRDRNPSDKWWQSAALSAPTLEGWDAKSISENAESRQMISLQGPSSETRTNDRPRDSTHGAELNVMLEANDQSMSADTSEQKPQDADQALQLIRMQYQEALYFSKVSNFTLPFRIRWLTSGRLPWHIFLRDHCLELEQVRKRNRID